MKKLNRKGFTLVELLAVIVILAIVIGIAIPGISGVIQGAKGSAMSTTVKAAADWLEDQVTMYNVDSTTVDPAFKENINGGTTGGTAIELTNPNSLLKAMGLTDAKVSKAKICITNDGKVFVEVIQIPEGSEYYTTENWTASGEVANANYSSSDVTEINRAGSATPDTNKATITSCN